MRTLKTWQWQETVETEYKEILGFDNLNIWHKIKASINGRVYDFCPRSGESDHVYLFAEDTYITEQKSTHLFVMCENTSMEYIGLDVYLLGNKDHDLELITEIHIQDSWDFAMYFDILNPSRFFDYVPMTKAKKLQALLWKSY